MFDAQGRASDVAEGGLHHEESSRRRARGESGVEAECCEADVVVANVGRRHADAAAQMLAGGGKPEDVCIGTRAARESAIFGGDYADPGIEPARRGGRRRRRHERRAFPVRVGKRGAVVRNRGRHALIEVRADRARLGVDQAVPETIGIEPRGFYAVDISLAEFPLEPGETSDHGRRAGVGGVNPGPAQDDGGDMVELLVVVRHREMIDDVAFPRRHGAHVRDA